MKFLLNLLGIIVILEIIFLLSRNRKNIKWKAVIRALMV